jgi:hypothetical protein
MRVWQVLTDFPRYGAWNPFITSVSGRLEPGAKLRVHLSMPEGRDVDITPTVTRCQPAEELRWKGYYIVPKLFQGDHFFSLHPADGDSTRLVHGEDFSGMLVKMMGRALTQTARGFVYMNEALKRYVETGAAR